MLGAWVEDDAIAEAGGPLELREEIDTARSAAHGGGRAWWGRRRAEPQGAAGDTVWEFGEDEAESEDVDGHMLERLDPRPVPPSPPASYRPPRRSSASSAPSASSTMASPGC